MNKTDFEELVKSILNKYDDVRLRNKWQEAVSFGTGSSAIAYWIRDSEDIVNIVWLSPNSIRDISWFPKMNLAVFNFLPLQNIIAIESREQSNIAKSFGFPVEGKLLVRVFAPTKQAVLAWAADTGQQERSLRAFTNQVFTAYTKATGS